MIASKRTCQSETAYFHLRNNMLRTCRCTSFLSGTLYRVVYDDCYTDEYTLLRAKKSFGEKKYDIFEQNCEHSTRWCKTGIHDSIQMEICFTTAGKAAVIVVLRLISLLMLWLLHLSGDTQTPQGEKLRTQYVQLYQNRKPFVARCLCRIHSL